MRGRAAAPAQPVALSAVFSVWFLFCYFPHRPPSCLPRPAQALKRSGMEASHGGRKVALRVKRSEPVLVHPADGTAGDAAGFYYLSNLDQNLAVIMKSVHFYSAGETGASAAAGVVLKDALAKVLTYFHPYTGNLAISPEGKLVVSCTGAGVPFVEAVADCNMDAVGDITMADPALLESLIYTNPRAKNLLEIPLLTIQVTGFRCGGFVLGMAMNHCMADGMSALGFLRDWAETARGLPLSTAPFLDRSLLLPRQPPKVEFAHPEFAEVEDVSGVADLYGREAMSYRSFTFDAATLARLKRAVQEEDTAAAGGTFSSFSVLVALVWRARNMALRMTPAQKTKLLFAVDVRGRLDPPLPPGYFGNGMAFACCLCEAGELAARTLSSTARMVRDAARGVTDGYVRSAVDYFEVTRARPSLTGTLLVTTWTRLGLEKVDFGWGEAAQMGSAELPRREVALLLPHRVEEGGVVLVLGLPVSAMEAFQELVKVKYRGENERFEGPHLHA